MCDLLETDLRLRDSRPLLHFGDRGLRGLLSRRFRGRAHRPENAGNGRAGILLAAGRQPARRACDRHDGLRQPGFRHRRNSHGAYDFVTKPIEMELLAVILRRAVERRQLQRQIHSLRETVERAGRFEELLGQSPPMLQALRPVGPDRRFRGLGADPGRKRFGQGGGRPGHCTSTASGARNRSSRSTSPACPTRCWKASCSVM